MSVAKKNDISRQSVRTKLKLDALPRQRNLTQFDSPNASMQDLGVLPSRIPVRAETMTNGFHPRSGTDQTPRSVSDGVAAHLRAATLNNGSPPGSSPRVLSPVQPVSPQSLSPVERSPLQARSRSAAPPAPPKDVIAYDDDDDLYDAPPPPPKKALSSPITPTGSFVHIPSAGQAGHGPHDGPPSPSMTIGTIPDDGHSYYPRSSSLMPGGGPNSRMSAYTEGSHYSQDTGHPSDSPPSGFRAGRLPHVPVLPRGAHLPRKSLEERQREIEEKRERDRLEMIELQRQEQAEMEKRKREKAEQQRREEEEENKKRRNECDLVPALEPRSDASNRELERRRWITERQRKAEERRQQEERQRQEEEIRKTAERAKRVEDARKAQKQREADGRAAEEERRWKEKEREQEEQHKRERLNSIAKQFIAEAGGQEVALSGECTVQTSWTTVWRRRSVG